MGEVFRSVGVRVGRARTLKLIDFAEDFSFFGFGLLGVLGFEVVADFGHFLALEVFDFLEVFFLDRLQLGLLLFENFLVASGFFEENFLQFGGLFRVEAR